MKVYAAINAVQAELAHDGITKSRRNQQQGYNFRGIDDVYNALSPLLAKHGLCILPRILAREVQERQTKQGGVLFYVTVEAEFDFVCAEDGSKHIVRTFGEAMDSADKATNKAMSAAYKYAAFQAFAIPTEGDNDADAVTPSAIKPVSVPAVAGRPTDGVWESMSDEEQAYLQKVADEVVAILATGDHALAYDCLSSKKLDTEEKAAVWTRLDSKTRTALKKADAAAKAKTTQEAA